MIVLQLNSDVMRWIDDVRGTTSQAAFVKYLVKKEMKSQKALNSHPKFTGEINEPSSKTSIPI